VKWLADNMKNRVATLIMNKPMPPTVFKPITSEEIITESPENEVLYAEGPRDIAWALQYRVIKDEEKLVMSTLEHNGFSPTNSHDWNLLWLGIAPF
jgi:hypothetical protein